MIHKIKVLFIGLFTIIAFQSCEMAGLFYDIDDTENVSEVSVKPLMVLNGEPIISFTLGTPYIDAGVLSSEVIEGDDDLNASTSIISGDVDVSKIGFYVVTYKSTNTYNWSSYIYRAVLIYEGSPWGVDIASNYRVGFNFESTISKYSIKGYWQMDNAWAEDNVDFPIVFAEAADGTYKIVPGEHPNKGRYSGIGVLIGTSIKFTINSISPSGIRTSKNFTWIKN